MRGSEGRRQSRSFLPPYVPEFVAQAHGGEGTGRHARAGPQAACGAQTRAQRAGSTERARNWRSAPLRAGRDRSTVAGDGDERGDRRVHAQRRCRLSENPARAERPSGRRSADQGAGPQAGAGVFIAREPPGPREPRQGWKPAGVRPRAAGEARGRGLAAQRDSPAGRADRSSLDRRPGTPNGVLSLQWLNLMAHRIDIHIRQRMVAAWPAAWPGRNPSSVPTGAPCTSVSRRCRGVAAG